MGGGFSGNVREPREAWRHSNMSMSVSLLKEDFYLCLYTYCSIAESDPSIYLNSCSIIRVAILPPSLNLSRTPIKLPQRPQPNPTPSPSPFPQAYQV